MPGPGDVPQVQVGGAALWIVADKSDEEVPRPRGTTSPTWLSAESQALWALTTGYVPVRTDAWS